LAPAKPSEAFRELLYTPSLTLNPYPDSIYRRSTSYSVHL
jgi:hypothetical protein